MKLHRKVIFCIIAAGAATLLPAAEIPITAQPPIRVNTSTEPVEPGKFEPTWQSLKQYEVPEWFRDAKFGIWAHWGPQCQPERGDWYAREMYSQGNPKYKEHLKLYGHPSQFGFKDVIHQWKADKWDPDKLLALYRRAGAQYFFALANHHDNFDNWDSKYQPWNSVNMGPKKDLVGGWAKAARKHGMKFGVSVHAAHTWSWMEAAQGADKDGPLAGVAYDGKLTKSDGKGKWWEGYDPQDLYEQRHEPSPGYQDLGSIHGRWNWDNLRTLPNQAYNDKFYHRTMDLINQYKPDLLYFDDTALPLWPVSDAGLQIAAHFYNSNNKWHGPQNDGVLFGKILSPEQRQCMVWDIERGSSNTIEPEPWQTDTCIGGWHYDRGIFNNHRYKSSKTVVQTLIDVVSKNGSLLLSIPLKRDGTLDSDEVGIVEGIAEWMEVHQEAIHGTRPWKVLGEGPQMASTAPIQAQGFNEGKGRNFSADDLRFTTKGTIIYAFVMGAPKAAVRIRSLGSNAKLLESRVLNITMLGSGEKIVWEQAADALVIEEPQGRINESATVFKITTQGR